MSKQLMSIEEHREHHLKLHRALDELLADFITQTGRRPSETTVMEFLTWSSGQTVNPTAEPYITKP